jgi:PAS domain S-box-containing protein
MQADENEEKLLQSVALQNAQAVLLARERAERELRESNERITNILESISDAFVVFDKEWRFSYVNPQAEQVVRPLNKSRSVLLGKNFWTEFPELVGTPVETNFRRSVAERVKVEFEIFYPPLNAWFYVRAYPGRDGLSVYFLDITSQKNAAETVRVSGERLHAVFNQAAVGISIVSLDGRFVEVNQKCSDILGYSVEELKKLRVSDVTHANDQETTRSFIGRLLAGEISHFAYEKRYVRKDGSFVWSLTTVNFLKDAEGKPQFLLGVLEDITSRKLAEAALRETHDHLEKRVEERTTALKEANDALRDLSGRLLKVQDDERRRLARELHDSVGQILAALSMNIAAVQSQVYKLDALGARAALENAQLVQQASTEIRTLSHLLHPPLLEIAGLASALRWYVDGFSERSQIKVDMEIPSDFSRLPNDTELAIFRIVQECLTNIHRHAGSSTASIRIQQDGSRLRVEVRDYGKGIPPAKQRVILDSSRGGVGFGGIRERLRQLGGTLEIKSNGTGTVVSATLQLT